MVVSYLIAYADLRLVRILFDRLCGFKMIANYDVVFSYFWPDLRSFHFDRRILSDRLCGFRMIAD
jgi:hypothetical protein